VQGSVTFTAPDGRYLWYTIELRTTPPEAECTLEVVAPLRKVAALEITLTLTQTLSLSLSLSPTPTPTPSLSLTLTLTLTRWSRSRSPSSTHRTRRSPSR
jgi:hypothetical protein